MPIPKKALIEKGRIEPVFMFKKRKINEIKAHDRAIMSAITSETEIMEDKLRKLVKKIGPIPRLKKVTRVESIRELEIMIAELKTLESEIKKEMEIHEITTKPNQITNLITKLNRTIGSIRIVEKEIVAAPEVKTSEKDSKTAEQQATTPVEIKTDEKKPTDASKISHKAQIKFLKIKSNETTRLISKIADIRTKTEQYIRATKKSGQKITLIDIIGSKVRKTEGYINRLVKAEENSFEREMSEMFPEHKTEMRELFRDVFLSQIELIKEEYNSQAKVARAKRLKEP